jgi:peptidoglycan/LPS O-acetylase OafA/YrhL
MTSTPQLSMNASRQWADRLGVWTSSLCVVHCILTPVLISSSAVLAHFLPAEERVHRSLALLVALFGAIALLVGFRKHGRRRILILMSAGLSCIAAAAWFGDKLPSHSYEVAITMVGSALMITAHRLNHTFCKSCECAARC